MPWEAIQGQHKADVSGLGARERAGRTQGYHQGNQFLNSTSLLNYKHRIPYIHAGFLTWQFHAFLSLGLRRCLQALATLCTQPLGPSVCPCPRRWSAGPHPAPGAALGPRGPTFTHAPSLCCFSGLCQRGPRGGAGTTLQGSHLLCQHPPTNHLPSWLLPSCRLRGGKLGPCLSHIFYIP